MINIIISKDKEIASRYMYNNAMNSERTVIAEVIDTDAIADNIKETICIHDIKNRLRFYVKGAVQIKNLTDTVYLSKSSKKARKG